MPKDNNGTQSLVLTRNRSTDRLREREILRVVVTLRSRDPSPAFERARNDVLRWASNRAGGALPDAAWSGDMFEHMFGGRTVIATSFEGVSGPLWALRSDDPDKEVPGRVWTTEAMIARPERGHTKMSIRLMVSSAEPFVEIRPHVPGLLHQMADHSEIVVSRSILSPYPSYVASNEDVDQLVQLLESTDRILPVIVASGDDRAEDSSRPFIDTESLAWATFGLGSVVVLPSPYGFALTEALGKERSVFRGAVRLYMPGFDATADPFEHRLFLGHIVMQDPSYCEAEVRKMVARESLRRTRIGHDLISFFAVRSEALDAEYKRLITESESTRLEAADRRIEALERQIDEANNEIDQNYRFVNDEEYRAQTAEARLGGLIFRVQHLEEALSKQQIDPDRELVLPQIWKGFASWCDRSFGGRLALSPQARRGIKKAQFNDPSLAAQCLRKLASDCRERFINGGGKIANIFIRSGIEISSCGGDSFRFQWEHGYMEADWHVKSGGNTHDPGRCLRIYFCFDEVTQQIVVADMPAHRPSGAT